MSARGANMRVLMVLAFAAAGAAVTACGRDSQRQRGGGPGDVDMPQASPKVVGATDTTGLPNEGVLSRVAIGDLAGIGNNTLDIDVRSPYANDQSAITEGQKTFVDMNCASCHGYDLKGGMGPDLTDTYWRYGGSPADIYKSIYEGRPQGMPAWGRALSPDIIWKVVAYIESKGGAFPGRLADLGRQGELGDQDTSSGSTLKGRNVVH